MSSLGLPVTLWVAVVSAVVLIDVTGFLVAAARAQQMADAAALAAVGEDVRSPRTAAEEVAGALGGSVVGCECDRQGHATVVVAVAVPGLVIPRVGAGGVQATASAQLVTP